MSEENEQEKINQVEGPRVKITYRAPRGKGEQVELPFVIGVMANLSGNKSIEDRGALDKRQFTRVIGGNLDGLMEQLKPSLSLVVKNTLTETPKKGEENLSVRLNFEKLSDFEPLGIADQVPTLKQLVEIRNQLTNLRAYLDGKPGAQKFVWDELQKLVARHKETPSIPTQDQSEV